MLRAATAAVGGLTALTAPVASAAPPPAPQYQGQRPGDWHQQCRPEHQGPDWRWVDARRGGHWEHRVFDRRAHRFVWMPLWRDTQRCLPGRPGSRQW